MKFDLSVLIGSTSAFPFHCFHSSDTSARTSPRRLSAISPCLATDVVTAPGVRPQTRDHRQPASPTLTRSRCGSAEYLRHPLPVILRIGERADRNSACSSAAGVGIEPTRRLHVQRFSSRQILGSLKDRSGFRLRFSPHKCGATGCDASATRARKFECALALQGEYLAQSVGQGDGCDGQLGKGKSGVRHLRHVLFTSLGGADCPCAVTPERAF